MSVVWGHNSFLGTHKFLLSTSGQCVVVSGWKSFLCHVLGLLPVPPSLPGCMPCILPLAEESVPGFFVYTLLDDEGDILNYNRAASHSMSCDWFLASEQPTKHHQDLFWAVQRAKHSQQLPISDSTISDSYVPFLGSVFLSCSLT